MSINAVKGVEIGDGLRRRRADAARRTPTRCARATMAPQCFCPTTPAAYLGGISTGQPIVARFAFKPTSSILTPRRTINAAGDETDIVTKGRHDPCVGIRAVPVGEAMIACVLADAFLRHRGQVG